MNKRTNDISALMNRTTLKGHDFGFKVGDEVELGGFYIECVPREQVFRATVVGDYPYFYLLDTGRVKLAVNKAALFSELDRVKARRMKGADTVSTKLAA